MRVLKRNGQYEQISFDKVLRRIRLVNQECGGLSIDIDAISQTICSNIFDVN